MLSVAALIQILNTDVEKDEGLTKLLLSFTFVLVVMRRWTMASKGVKSVFLRVSPDKLAMLKDIRDLIDIYDEANDELADKIADYIVTALKIKSKTKSK